MSSHHADFTLCIVNSSLCFLILLSQRRSCFILTIKEIVVVDSLYAARVHAQGSDLDFL